MAGQFTLGVVTQSLYAAGPLKTTLSWVSRMSYSGGKSELAGDRWLSTENPAGAAASMPAHGLPSMSGSGQEVS